jgi:hypothetical protein
MKGIMWKDLRSGLNEDDIYDLKESDRDEKNESRMERLWNENVEKSGEK